MVGSAVRYVTGEHSLCMSWLVTAWPWVIRNSCHSCVSCHLTRRRLPHLITLRDRALFVNTRFNHCSTLWEKVVQRRMSRSDTSTPDECQISVIRLSNEFLTEVLLLVVWLGIVAAFRVFTAPNSLCASKCLIYQLSRSVILFLDIMLKNQRFITTNKWS